MARFKPFLAAFLAFVILIQAPGRALAQTVARPVAAAPVVPMPVGAAGSVSGPSRGRLELPGLKSPLALPSAPGMIAPPGPSASPVRQPDSSPVAAAQAPMPALAEPVVPAAPDSRPAAQEPKGSVGAGLEVESRGETLVVNGAEVPAADKVARMEAGEARTAGAALMDALLRTKSAAGAADPAGSDGAEPAAAGAGQDAPPVYASRILHLHYPHRSWDHVAGDMAADDKVKATNGEHPAGALREIMNRLGWGANKPGGLTVSFTAALMEIARKLWGMGWVARWREAIGWKTAQGTPRMEMALTGFHFLYGLLPWGSAADALVRWNVRYHELLMKEFWGGAPGGAAQAGRLKIFRPPEVGFSPEMVPALVKAGVQVVVVDSHHVSRSLTGYDANGMPNLPPPNKADQRTASPYPMNYATTGKDGRNSKDALPYAYLPHWLRYKAADGREYKVIVFPMAGGPSYIAGYQDFPNDVVQNAARYAAAGRPLALGLDTDGDNAWGGGHSSYMESMPKLAQWLDANGHQFGTIEEYLARYPVPADDVIDWVEPGAWPNADWGTPQFTRWLWPPIKTAGVPKPEFDPSAWNFKLQFHALLTMAVHWLMQGEAAMKAGNPGWELDMAEVVKADTDPAAGPLEKAVQQVLRSFDSGHVYYGPEPDFLQIPVLAAKAAMDAAKTVLGADAPRLGPTIWGPNRFPWNPGGENRGEVYGWRSHAYAPEFDAYGFVYAAPGLKRVELKWRVSSDGRTSPGPENLSHEGGGAAGPWNAAAMTLKDPYPQAEWSNLPKGDRVPELPAMAHARVSPGSEVLVDYYIEAEDAAGRVERSPIMHVFVGKTS
ncbi:MAG: hypothetical protein HY927_14770 [Elusimicrobia bacterium]|nr:hypothetical protein [Elusimicrobiota bacterium]